jgi:RNA polymerase sigma-70 factor (ECF subfamily)
MNQGTFEQMVLPHRDALYRQALRLTHQNDEAEDLVQETLVRAFRGFETVRVEGSVRPWLFTILRNRFICTYRSRARAPKQLSLDALEDPDYYLPRSADLEQQAFLKLEHEALCRAVAQLAPTCRRILVLSDFQGYTYRQISEYLSIPMGTVRSSLFRARNQIRRSLYAWRPDVQQRTTTFRS